MGRFTYDSAEYDVTPPLRRFTVDEADRALVLVKRIVADVVRDYARLLELQEIIDASGVAGSPQAHAAREEISRTAESLQTCIAEADAVGVVLKDWAVGIVDFPTCADGREVQLCWRLGEPRVAHWHETDAGFAERQPIETLPSAGTYASADRPAAWHAPRR